MKRVISLLAVVIVLCGISTDAVAQQSGKTLIVYFSESGNTQGMANIIHELIGADIVEIEMQHPYSDNYSALLDEAERDLIANARPALRTHIDNMDEYTTVLLGYPNWYALLPMPVYTFLESYDFSGKRIVPFCSHGNGMFGESVANICKSCPDADVREALSVTYSGGSSLRSEIRTWLSKHELLKE